MIGITRKQNDCLNFVGSYTREHGYAPTVQEIADALDMKSKGGAVRVLQILEHRGRVRRIANRARAIEIVHAANDDTTEAKIAQHLAIIRGLNNPAPAVSGIVLTGIRIPTPPPRTRPGDSLGGEKVGMPSVVEGSLQKGRA